MTAVWRYPTHQSWNGWLFFTSKKLFHALMRVYFVPSCRMFCDKFKFFVSLRLFFFWTDISFLLGIIEPNERQIRIAWFKTHTWLLHSKRPETTIKGRKMQIYKGHNFEATYLFVRHCRAELKSDSENPTWLLHSKMPKATIKGRKLQICKGHNFEPTHLLC